MSMSFQTQEIRLYYPAPTQAVIDDALETVTALCHARLNELPVDREEYAAYLEKELARVKHANSAFQFLLQKEVADLSREQGYPIGIYSPLSAELVPYLLGLTVDDPLQFTQYRLHPELDRGRSRLKGGAMWVARAVVPLVQARLEKVFGHTETTTVEWWLDIYCIPEEFERLFQLTGHYPTVADFDSAVCTHVMRDFVDQLQKPNDIVDHLPKINNDEFEEFVEQLSTVEVKDFYTLARICSCEYRARTEPLRLEDFENPSFFATREELYALLTAAGMPNDEAVEFVYDFLGSGEKRQKYEAMLDAYPLSEETRQFIHRCNYLVSYMLGNRSYSCAMAWYALHFPEAYEQVKKEGIL